MSEQTKGGTTRHPSTTKLFQQAAQRWMDLKKQHTEASDYMWAAMIASQFTQNELALLRDYISLRDRQLLKAVRRAND